MSILKKLSQMFSRSSEESATVSPVSSDIEESADAFQTEPPMHRRVIQPTVLAGEEEWQDDSGQILIKAQPSRDNGQCKFMVNRPLFKGHSWMFPNFESAAGSPLAEAAFSVDSVETVLVDGSTAVITKTGPKGVPDWQALAREVGAAFRQAIESGQDLISKEIVTKIPSEDVVRNQIQQVIDTEVNPGVAGHGGRITLTRVEGNTVTIEMGGGCQGCSAADMTLKQGIHSAFRNKVPYVGAIYDETDHSAGVNPFYR